VVCPPCEACSSISCHSEQFCKSIGFDKSWYEGIKQNLASAQQAQGKGDGYDGSLFNIDIELSLPDQGGLYALYPPQHAKLGNKPVLFYEIYVANESGANITKVEALEGGKVLKTISGEELGTAVRMPSMGIDDYVVYMWVPLAQGDMPSVVTHKVHLSNGDVLSGADVKVDYAKPLSISPPVYGEGWLAAEAPVNTNHHRKGLFTATAIAPTPVVGQRYAIDWMLYGPNGKLYRTNGMANEDWWNYGAEIRAVTDGVIAGAQDGIPSNEVGVEPTPVTLLYVAGNNVVQQLDDGKTYALYAHMIPGSVRVKIGDKVKKGDVLGLLGNTGNSGAPHLHFHLDTSKDVLFGEGVPYAMDYQHVGSADWKAQMDKDGIWDAPAAKPVAVEGGMPVDGEVVNIGPQQNGPLVRTGAFESGVKYKTKEGKFTVLDLHGSFREMGRQYGYLMRSEMQETYKRIMDETAARGLDRPQVTAWGNVLYDSMPERYAELMGGMSETSGLTLEQQKELNGGVVSLIDAYVLEQMNNATAKNTACSGVAFWGNYSKDGKLYFGRNWDMVKSLLVPYLPYMTLAVYHPDSGNTVANLEWVGEVYTETAMNDKGIFLELNNGGHSDPVHEGGRPFAAVKLLDFMFDSSSMADIDREFNTTLASDSYLIQVANKDAAYSYEWPTFGANRRSENVSGLLVAYNDFVPPYPAGWEGRIKPANPLDVRRSNFLAMANSPEYKGKMDEKLMQQFLAVPFGNGGGMLPDNVYQVIAVPEDYKMWLHGQNYSGWEEIDLKPLFFPNGANQNCASKGECPVKAGPASDGITISIVPQNEAGAALESGKLDYYLAPLSAEDVQGIKSNPSTAVALYPATSTFMGIYFNPAPAASGINPFSSQKARFALNFLIDKEKIAREVYGGAAFPVASIPWPGHPSYASISPAVDSFNITYDKAKGMKLLEEAMAGQGAAMVNGTWHYNGAPITLLMPLYNGTGATSAKRTFSEMVASDLKAAGFAVQMPAYSDYNEMPQYTTDPAAMRWNVDVSGAIFYGASKFQPAMFLAPYSQDGWWQYNNTAITAAEKTLGSAATQAEWDGANSLLARLYLNDSVGIWLVALDSNYGAGKGVLGIADNRFVGIGDYDTARQASVQGKKTLAIGTPELYDPQASWNPVVVESIYMMGLLNTIHDPAWTADPVTLEEKPYRWGFAIERYSAPQLLPQGAFMWSVAEKKWVATPANATAKTKVTYDLSRYIGANWHNGQKIGWADVLYFLASTSDRMYDAEKQKIASDQYKGTLDAVVGYRMNGNTLETYLNTQDLDNGNLLAVARMFQRAAPLEIYAAGDSLVFAQKKYSYGDVPSSGVPPLSMVNSTHTGDVLAAMGGLTDAQIAPMATVGGTNYLGSGTLFARLAADKAWNAAHGNLVISDGAFYLDYYNQTDGSAHLKAFRDPAYPFAAGRWIGK